MRLALFTDTYLPETNGVAGTLHRLSNHLNRRRIEHLLFTPNSVIEGSHETQVRSVANIPFFLYPECRIALPNRADTHKQLQTFQPDLLHIATPFNMGLLGLRYALKHHLPHVVSYHTHFDRYLEYYRLKSMIPLYWKYIQWFHRACDATCTPLINAARISVNDTTSPLPLFYSTLDALPRKKISLHSRLPCSSCPRKCSPVYTGSSLATAHLSRKCVCKPHQMSPLQAICMAKNLLLCMLRQICLCFLPLRRHLAMWYWKRWLQDSLWWRPMPEV